MCSVEQHSEKVGKRRVEKETTGSGVNGTKERELALRPTKGLIRRANQVLVRAWLPSSEHHVAPSSRPTPWAVGVGVRDVSGAQEYHLMHRLAINLDEEVPPRQRTKGTPANGSPEPCVSANSGASISKVMVGQTMDEETGPAGSECVLSASHWALGSVAFLLSLRSPHCPSSTAFV
ncbi:hypothetical protein D9611_006662 [Ephemerocybe angulata]|uniref:Uncharacterized protein n=1 Tax=Ephemerocybe angulata TaxID=980116 RepID=A0A8H5C8D6_9AGAR|nr:hypothetical protein D9611_006662 [Tulosesus angulatus]